MDIHIPLDKETIGKMNYCPFCGDRLEELKIGNKICMNGCVEFQIIETVKYGKEG